ncbi:phosphopantetheine-binding protein [Streptomyces longwoodensis]|uniref:phosphopantetheine-binding protein n=1 Tax=Streptomyces longwoodensis TaxID=68231 RepID=UPI0033EC297B
MPPLTYGQVTRAVLDAITAVLPTADVSGVTPHSKWCELEADSIDRVEILCKTAELLDLPAPDARLEGVPTVGALIQGVMASHAHPPACPGSDTFWTTQPGEQT